MDLYLYLQLVIESVLTKDYATYKGLHTLLHTKHVSQQFKPQFKLVQRKDEGNLCAVKQIWMH